MKYYKQIQKASVELVRLVKAKNSLIVCQAPMQSGKTGLIECAYEMLRREYPGCMGLYVTAHNHLDFISQNFLRLEHLESKDLYCLGLRERRRSLVRDKPLNSLRNSPILIFFDENHFGDGAIQTIFMWLHFNKLYPGREIVLIGVSATPFSSVERAGKAVVRFNFSDMPTYKSVTHMLAQGHIRDSEPLVKAGPTGRYVDQANPAFQDLNRLITSKTEGYAIIRVNSEDAYCLQAELKRLHSDSVHVRHWNQANQITNPEMYFSQKRPTFVVVIVQQKARMGNTIPTKYVKLVYEHSPKAAVATVAQGLTGRCCGHGKLNDDVIVYSRKKQARAYSLFECGKYQEFLAYLETHGLKASQRSALEPAEVEVVGGKLPGKAGSRRNDIIASVLGDLKDTHGITDAATSITVRRWTTNKKDRPRYKQAIEMGENPTLTKPEKTAGSLSIYYDNRKGHFDVYYAFRTATVLVTGALVASSDSFYSKLKQKGVPNGIFNRV